MSSTPLSVRVPPDLAAKLEKLAKATDRSKSWHMEQALSEYLRVQAWQIAHIEKSIKQAAAGRTVSHEDVKRRFSAWVKSRTRKAR